MKKAIQAIIKGRVQGVGFRWFAMQNARKYDVTGYVKNLVSGDVEILAEGEEEQLEEFISLMEKGPPFSNVVDVNTQRKEVSGKYSEFIVEY
jgi:acylphosphatase